jgi:hypothetical protein
MEIINLRKELGEGSPDLKRLESFVDLAGSDLTPEDRSNVEEFLFMHYKGLVLGGFQADGQLFVVLNYNEDGSNNPSIGYVCDAPLGFPGERFGRCRKAA